MGILNKSVAALLVLTSASAFAITDAQVFAFAEANYTGFFTGSATTGQTIYQGEQYNYRYYPASGNYLAVDTSGVIFILGQSTGGVLTTVGPVTAYAGAITAWEASVSQFDGTYTLSVTFTKNGVIQSVTSTLTVAHGVITATATGNPSVDLSGTVSGSGAVTVGPASGVCGPACTGQVTNTSPGGVVISGTLTNTCDSNQTGTWTATR